MTSHCSKYTHENTGNFSILNASKRGVEIMEVVIGPCIIRNSSGAVNIEGRDEIVLRNGGHDSQVLISMDIHNSSGELIAKLANNAWVYNEKERFSLTGACHCLVLADTENNKTILEISCDGKNQAQIRQGDFFSHTGKRIQILSEQLTIDGRPACSLNSGSSEQLTFDIEHVFAS